jgi:hypothetical protein
MRAIVIDPIAGSVREIDTPTDYRSLQRLVGGDIEPAHQFPGGDVLYVNENGIAAAEEALAGKAGAASSGWFEMGLHQPFAGPGVIVGAEDDEGVHGNAATALAEVARKVRFIVPASLSAEEGAFGPN